MDSKITPLKILVVTTMLVATSEGNCMATCQNICQQSNNPLTIPYSRPGKRGPKGDVGPRGEKGEIGQSCECPDVTALEQTILSLTKNLHKLEYNQALLLSSFDVSLPSDGRIVIQRRLDGSVDFYKGWQEYVDGFGNARGEFWLGLEKIHHLTTTYNMDLLRVDLEDRDGNTAYAEYSTFRIASSSDNYRLTIGGYSGTAGNSMDPNNNMMFSTFDRDNDIWHSSCAKNYHGAWWYSESCGYSNLNGGYSAVLEGSIMWFWWKENFDGLKSAQMSIRRH